MTTNIALYPYRHVPFIIGTVIILLPVIRAWLQSRAAERKRREKAAENERRMAALQRAREEARARRMAEVAEEERERLRVREEEKARRKAERDAARAAMPRRPRGRPPKAQNVPADNAAPPQAQPEPQQATQEPQQATQEPQQPFCWPPRGNEAFRNQRVVFTGKLRNMTREQAKLAVVRNGGVTQDHIIQGLTTMLVIGEKAVERKMQLAHDCGIRIVTDTEFQLMCSEQYTMTPDQFAAFSAMR